MNFRRSIGLVSMLALHGFPQAEPEIKFNLNRENSAALDSANAKIKAAQERNRLAKEIAKEKYRNKLPIIKFPIIDPYNSDK